MRRSSAPTAALAAALLLAVVAGRATAAGAGPAAGPKAVPGAAARGSVSAEDLAKVLGRQIQEMSDAVAAGDAAVWDRYLAPEVIYTGEDASVKNRSQLLADLKPLPKNISGIIKVTDLHVVPHGDIAIATYVLAEIEIYFGQTLHASYRETDTWQRQGGRWRLIAAQVLALLSDPPAIHLPARRLDEYAGVYSLTPEVSYTIRRQGDELVGERTGRKPETLRVEAADVLFVPGEPRLRKVFQRAPDGHLTGFVERRESWDIVWKRRPR